MVPIRLWKIPALAFLLAALWPLYAGTGEIELLEGTANIAGAEDPPAGAVLVVDLLDISREREKGDLLSRMRFEIDGGFPVNFEIGFDNGLIRQNGRYVLAAEVRDGGKVLYRSRQGFPVLYNDFAQRPDVFMEPVTEVDAIRSPVGYTWRLNLLSGLEPFGFTKAKMQFIETGEVRGNTGCNRFTASYDITGDRIEFSEFTAENRGCTAKVLSRSRSFVGLMLKSTHFERQDDVLYLLDPNGLELMRFDREF